MRFSIDIRTATKHLGSKRAGSSIATADHLSRCKLKFTKVKEYLSVYVKVKYKEVKKKQEKKHNRSSAHEMIVLSSSHQFEIGAQRKKRKSLAARMEYNNNSNWRPLQNSIGCLHTNSEQTQMYLIR